MAATDLNDDDKAILAELVRETIAASRYPLSPRMRIILKAILAKLDPAEKLAPEPLPARRGSQRRGDAEAEALASGGAQRNVFSR